MKYMRDNLPDDYGIVRLQDKILEIAVYINDFCDRHGIDYCLMGGSALGAKRQLYSNLMVIMRSITSRNTGFRIMVW